MMRNCFCLSDKNKFYLYSRQKKVHLHLWEMNICIFLGYVIQRFIVLLTAYVKSIRIKISSCYFLPTTFSIQTLALRCLLLGLLRPDWAPPVVSGRFKKQELPLRPLMAWDTPRQLLELSGGTVEPTTSWKSKLRIKNLQGVQKMRYRCFL